MNPVNLFFACDNAYVPFLAVTLTSLKENCNPKRDYALRILHTGLDPENIRRLTDSFASDGFTMEFIDITQAVEQFADKLHTRDYYSKSTYYRLFIPDLFPGLDKALYLDSDVVLLGDVSELYDVIWRRIWWARSPTAWSAPSRRWRCTRKSACGWRRITTSTPAYC